MEVALICGRVPSINLRSNAKTRMAARPSAYFALSKGAIVVESRCDVCGAPDPIEPPMLPAQWKAAYTDLPDNIRPFGPPGLADTSGPDFWCFYCEKVYCRRHWVLICVFESGHYDGIDGVCPEGHRNAEVER
jgi:hypothetical protein